MQVNERFNRNMNVCETLFDLGYVSYAFSLWFYLIAPFWVGFSLFMTGITLSVIAGFVGHFSLKNEFRRLSNI